MYWYAYSLGKNLEDWRWLETNRKAWKWYCLAAHKGHPRAQRKMGSFYLHGHDPVTKDIVRAYMWFTLSGAELNWIENNVITPRQVAEARRLVAEWRPNPALCNLEATQAGS